MPSGMRAGLVTDRPCSRFTPGLLPPLRGMRVLDVACGQGRMCRYLASQGAAVVGIDLSVAMLNRARALGTEGIDYVHADAAQPPDWWDVDPSRAAPAIWHSWTSTTSPAHWPP